MLKNVIEYERKTISLITNTKTQISNLVRAKRLHIGCILLYII